MRSPFRLMYLRPGNLWKEFIVKRSISKNVNGKYIVSFEDAGTITGILADADKNLSDRMKHRWEQAQHSLTHTLVVSSDTDVKKGDFLILEERCFLVLLADGIGSLGASGLIYLEERNDLK